MRQCPKVAGAAALLLLAACVVPGGVAAQTGQISAAKPYAESEASTGYYGEAEPLPGAYQLFLRRPESRGGFLGVGPVEIVRRQSFRADAHDGVRGYTPRRDCLDCHANAARNIHSARTSVTCRQCHRAVPIAGVQHYYSPLNPIRRHAYVCAKCHEGATANFATYVVHEPDPIARGTAERFPALFYGVWIMLLLAGGVFVFFIPYVLAWGLRELVGMVKEGLQRGRA